MKCLSCESEINPKWKFAIEQNTCPLCGLSIMEEHLKNLLTSLNDIMSKLQEYPDQLNDWLLSNFNYIKTDAPNLLDFVPKDQLQPIVLPSSPPQVTENDIKIFKENLSSAKNDKKFTVKIKTETGEQEIEAEKIQEEERTNEFFKRAEAVKPKIDGFRSTAEKTEHLKKIALQIKRAGTSAILDDSGEDSYISPDMMDEADPDAVAEMESLFEDNEISSSLPAGLSGDDDIPAVVLNMANKANGSKHKSNPADLMKLQQSHYRLEESRRNFESGASRGKGGFSRV